VKLKLNWDGIRAKWRVILDGFEAKRGEKGVKMSEGFESITG